MGFLDHLFKTKPSEEKKEEEKNGAQPAARASGESADAAPDPGAFLHPKNLAPHGVGILYPATRSGPPRAPEKGSPAADARQEIVLTLGDVLPRLPTQLLHAGWHDEKRELRFSIDDLSADIARGRAAVPLSKIAALCPEVFAREIAPDDDLEIRLPLQKLVEQIGLLRARVTPAPAVPIAPEVALAKDSQPAAECFSGRDGPAPCKEPGRPAPNEDEPPADTPTNAAAPSHVEISAPELAAAVNSEQGEPLTSVASPPLTETAPLSQPEAAPAPLAETAQAAETEVVLEAAPPILTAAPDAGPMLRVQPPRLVRPVLVQPPPILAPAAEEPPAKPLAHSIPSPSPETPPRENRDLAATARELAALPGVLACALECRGETAVAGEPREGFDPADLLPAATRLRDAAGTLPLGFVENIALTGERASISIFSRPGVLLAVLHTALSPATRERLATDFARG